jgi:NADPH-dependent ferric siderophore reductase
MSHDKTLFRLTRHPLQVRVLAVKRVTAITPEVRRVTLTGAELEGFTTLAPEDHVKLFFPHPGERRPTLPVLGPLGLRLPTFGPKPIGRDYTPRRCDPQAQELDIDFFLHGQGVASAWAARAEPGQLLGVAGPRGSYVMTRDFPWQLLIGDETALPAMARRVEELPSTTRALVVALVNGPAEEQPLRGRGPIEVRWVHRPAPNADASERLLAALSTLELPEGQGFTFVAGEVSEVRRVYGYLLRERGLPKSHLHVSGNWKRGVVDHDHHETIEP